MYKAEIASLPFETLSAFSATLEACSNGIQDARGPEVPYNSEALQNIARRAVTGKPDIARILRGLVQERYPVFKRETVPNDFHGVFRTQRAHYPTPFITMPESPHSFKSVNTQLENGLKTVHITNTPTSQRQHLPVLSEALTAGAFVFPNDDGLEDCTTGDEGSVPAELNSLNHQDSSSLASDDMWAFMPKAPRLDESPVQSLTAMGSSTLSLFDPAVDHLRFDSALLQAPKCSSPGTDASLPRDSPSPHSLSGSIFDEFSMPDFDRPSRQPPLTPAASMPEADLLALGLPDPAMLQPPALEGARPRRLPPAARRASEADLEDLQDLDFEPRSAKRTRQGSKPRRVPKAPPRDDDFLDYQPTERRKTAITARGRKVNCLQLSEEDVCEESVDGSNRRSKHHNPWTVEETEALVYGVESCGGGKWADIKKLGLHAIEKRSAVDLKDKWRNLQAALHRTKSDKKREIPASLLQRVKVLVPLTATKARGEARPAAGRKQVRGRGGQRQR